MEKSMDNIILSKIDEIINIIKNSDEYKKYIEVSDKMKKNKEIMTLIDEVKFLQKRLVKEEAFGNDISSIDEEINKKLEQLEEYPIYLEYTYLQEDLDSSISLVKTSIENYINNITN